MQLKMEPSGTSGKKPTIASKQQPPPPTPQQQPPTSSSVIITSSAGDPSSLTSKQQLHHQNGSAGGGVTSSAVLPNGAKCYVSRSKSTTTTTTTSSLPSSTSNITTAVGTTTSTGSSISHSWSRVTNTLPLRFVIFYLLYYFNFCFSLKRILVLKDLVGAIIGRQGGTIKQITQETHARVDVHRKEHSPPNENVIMIYGSPENCSQACRRILEVMQQEAETLNRPEEIVLKILASDNLIGRIIGKGGNTIKRIMQQTDTSITVNR